MTSPVDYEHHEARRAFHPPATVAAGVQNLADKLRVCMSLVGRLQRCQAARIHSRSVCAQPEILPNRAQMALSRVVLLLSPDI